MVELRSLRSAGRAWALAGAIIASGLSWLGATPAHAVPAFAEQIGQPCQACHVGGFGPQLTTFGRNFKLHGYTARTDSFNVPLSAMAVASFVNTAKAQTPTPGFGPNNNFALDQISVFFAGGLGQHLGAFIQTTYDGIARAFTWDNLDVRAVTTVQIKDADVLLGASLNNSPTVQDAWNTTPAWGYPYTGSALAPSPSASPLMSGALAQTSLGMTAYAWIDSKYYVEAGAYGSPGATTLTHLGADPTSPGSIKGLAPYARIAYQRDVDGGTLEVGAFGMRTSIYPALDRSIGLTDDFTDVGFDASYIKTLASSDVITANLRYMHEQQDLNYTCSPLNGAIDCPTGNSLNDVRADVSYYWRDKIGGTVQVFDTSGSANSYVYQTLGGNRIGKPDSAGVTVQLDGTPFGNGGSPFGSRFNMRVGVQYSFYTQYNGASSNYDGMGGKASDNNTLRVFTWIAY